VNGGANLTTADQVSVEFQYTHPAAPGAPIPYFRMRVKPPGGNHLPWGRYFDANGRNSFTVKLLPGHPSPPGGTYEIQVQIQDGGARYSNVATGHVIRASPTPSTLPAPVEYRVGGSEVPGLIGHARLRGYLNTAEPLNNTSQCSSWQNDGQWHLRMAKLVIPVPLGAQATPQPRCRFGFFKGKPLQYGWRLKSAAFTSWSREPATWVVEQAIKPTGMDAWFSIAGTGTGAMGSGEVRVSTLIFEGPPGSTWRDAFKP
jgi:hypothetical protein